jgi:type VI secretion system protein ImpH
MASSDRPGPALIRRLLEQPRGFSFFALVKLMQRQGRDVHLPGGAGPPSRENARFRPPLHIGFPISDIDSVEATEFDDAGEPSRFRVDVNFMGLYGPSSPLPTHFSEHFLWAPDSDDGDGARDFVDLFHHRMISYVFRAWLKYRYSEQFDAVALDDFSRRMLCLIGVGTPGMEAGSGLPLLPLLRTAGLLGDRHRSAIGLERFLRDHFGIPSIRIEPCIEHHARVPSTQAMRLGRPTARLGDTAVLGEYVIDRAGRFRIVLGPIDLVSARRFLPGSDELPRLVKLTRLYVRDPLDFELQIRIPAGQIAPLRLTPRAQLGLGHLTWLSPDGRHEGRATLSVRAVDPLYRRPAGPAVPVPREEAPRPASTVTVRSTSPASAKSTRVTTIRRS